MRADLHRIGQGARRVEESDEHVEAASALLAKGNHVGMFGGVPSAAAAAARLGAVQSDHAEALDAHRLALSEIASKAHLTAKAVEETDNGNADAIAGVDG